MKKPDDFRISLSIRHPTLDASAISKSLNLEPQFAWSVGDPNLVGMRPRTATLWRRVLAEGSGEADFDGALKRTLLLLSDQHDVLHQFATSDGELTLTVAIVAGVQDGKAAELRLAPSFLDGLTRCSMGLVLETWTSPTKKRKKVKSKSAAKQEIG
jgi:hypothetical protein